MRPVTAGPKFHWFGYYDKWQFDPSDRYALGMEVDFEGRSPLLEDEIALGLIDLEDGDRWSEIGRTQAWCWQQGCMLQWRPGFARCSGTRAKATPLFAACSMWTAGADPHPAARRLFAQSGREDGRVRRFSPDSGHAARLRLRRPARSQRRRAGAGRRRHLGAGHGHGGERADRFRRADCGSALSARRPERGQALL